MNNQPLLTDLNHLRQAGKDEAKQAALAALEAHLGRLNDPGSFSDFSHPYHEGSRNAIQFAIALVKLSI